jgi:hypothetical protein
MTMMKSIENKGITVTIALKNELAGKASMPEVRRRMITRAAYPATTEEYTQFYGSYKQVASNAMTTL